MGYKKIQVPAVGDKITPSMQTILSMFLTNRSSLISKVTVSVSTSAQ